MVPGIGIAQAHSDWLSYFAVTVLRMATGNKR